MTETTKRDEREAFEAWCEKEGVQTERHPRTGVYCYPSARVAWRSWQGAWKIRARAALATAPEQTGEPAITQCWSTTDGTRCDNCGRGLSAHIDQRWCDPASTNRLTGEQIEALRIAADALIERYAAPIRAIIAATEGK